MGSWFFLPFRIFRIGHVAVDVDRHGVAVVPVGQHPDAEQQPQLLDRLRSPPQSVHEARLDKASRRRRDLPEKIVVDLKYSAIAHGAPRLSIIGLRSRLGWVNGLPSRTRL